MTQTVNFKWPQGNDLVIDLIYKEGDDPRTAVVVPLGSGYSVRMDVVNATTKDVLYTVNSDVADGPVEATLSNGLSKTPNVSIKLPRTLNLPGGALASVGTAGIAYDIFLRNTVSDTQVKILRGSITIESSNTLWV